MARLIPSFIDETAPPGERDVFNMLAGAPDDWTILHSLDLAPWERGRRTEVDFVLIIPDLGVACIEVKSHPSITFDGNRWYPDTIKRSPIRQARDCSYSLRGQLTTFATYVNEIPFVHLCIFPNAPFDVPKTVSVRPWEIMDCRAFRSFRTATEFAADVRVRIAHAIQDEVPKSTRLRQPLSPERVDKLVSMCHPIQKRRPDTEEQRQRRRHALEALLRDQQKPILSLWDTNERILVTGGAGTGKTLIAMEVALREAERGARVALVAFNSIVSNWMKATLRGHQMLPNLIVGTGYGVVTRLLGIEVPENPNPEFWQKQLPVLVEDRLTDPDLAYPAALDVLVVDEGQDILGRPELWGALAALLVNGDEHGRYAIFGDVEQQVLQAAGVPVLNDILHRTRIARWHMRENCRNHRFVGDTALALSGYPREVYSGYLRTGGSSTDVRYVRCRSLDDKVAAAKGCLQELRGMGVGDDNITFLSFCEPQRSVAAQLRRQGFRLSPAGADVRGLTFTSVHAYKGMESDAIILTDLNLDMAGLSRALFYTALTRSTGVVRVICDEQEAHILQTWAAGGFV